MASYLFPYVQQSVQPYSGPVELYGQALQYKNAKFQQSLNNIRNRYDSLLSIPLTNEQNQMKLRANMEGAMNKLSSLAVGDLTLPENQSAINSVFDPVINDQNILYDMAWTRNQKKEIDKADQLQKTKPELVPPQNLEPLYKAQEAFRSGDPNSRQPFSQFTPYYDFNSKMNTELDKIKADVDNQIVQGRGIVITGPDGSKVSIDNVSQQQLKQIKDAKVGEVVWNRLNTDAQALHQMSLDYSYNMNHGVYSPTQATQQIEGEIADLKSRVDYYNLAINQGEIPRDKAEATIKGLTSKLDQLTTLKSNINRDPNAYKDYYTFNKSIKDYIEGKVSQYSYTDEGKLEDVPFYGKLRDYQFDLLKEQWKAKYDLQKEQSKANAKVKDIPTVTPYKDLVENLEDNGKVVAAPEDVAALGNFSMKNGRLYNTFAQSGADPLEVLIVQPATNDMTPTQTKTLSQAQLMYGLNRDLEALGITKKEVNDVATAYDKSGTTHYVTKDVDGNEILRNISENPNYYGASTAQINAILAKYADGLSKLNINIKDPKSIIDIQKASADPQIIKAIQFGQTLNSLNGDFEVATSGNNVVKGDSGLNYVKGKVVVPASHLAALGISPNALVSSNLATWWNPTTSGGEDADDSGKYKKTTEAQVAINFYKPIAGNIADLNDKMLMNSKRLEGAGESTLPIREASRSAMQEFGRVLQSADTYAFPGASFVKNSNGDYVITQGTYDNKNLLNSINSVSWDIAIRSGVDPKKVQRDFTQILARNNTPLRRAQGAYNLEYNYALDKYGLQSAFGTSNINPNAVKTWTDLSREYPVSNLGFWGDEAHKLRASDHNTGNALDLGVDTVDMGNQVVEQLKSEAASRGIKYIIFNKKIWNPSISNDWRPYTGDNPHTDHIHISYN